MARPYGSVPHGSACDSPSPFDPAQRCALARGHAGLHSVYLSWSDAEDDTIQFPPIRETTRRRPPPPEVRRLEDRAGLLAALVHELQRELVELRDGQADDDEEATCGAVVQDVGGAWICGDPKGHRGPHNVSQGPRL